MCRLYQDAKAAANELVEKLSKNDWFIGIIVTPQKPHDFIICSKTGNSADAVETVRSVLDDTDNFTGNIAVGIYDGSLVRILPEGGDFAQNFYDKWIERQNKCSGKWGMMD
jgi:hypothetical protein